MPGATHCNLYGNESGIGISRHFNKGETIELEKNAVVHIMAAGALLKLIRKNIKKITYQIRIRKTKTIIYYIIIQGGVKRVQYTLPGL